MTAPVKRGWPKGRRRNLDPKKPKQFRMKQFVIDVVQEFMRKGTYTSQDAVVEHAILHAKACPNFKPGEPGLIWNEAGAPEKVDLSGL